MRFVFLIPCLLIGGISCSSPLRALSYKKKIVPILIDLTPYYKKDLSPINSAASPRLLRSAEGEEADRRGAPHGQLSGLLSFLSDFGSDQQPVLTNENSWNQDSAARSHSRYNQRRVLFSRFHYSPAVSSYAPRAPVHSGS
ncbi:uncharacterized protein LOC101174542 [Oryzias latipes]|uniref:uncharacterized protein LOC101174542 n=1 Tax=Oryzias latipes TaxID=8090 RepID=UPI0000EA167E|nr:uncharacterized protein LOC101174542 [Oryzias latipes]